MVIMNIIHKYVDLINATYHGLTVIYPETIRDNFRPPFLIDFRDTIENLFIKNDYYWMEMVSVLSCIILLMIIRHLLCEKCLVNLLLEYGLIYGHDHHRFGNNLWNCLFYMHTFLISWLIITDMACFEYPERLWDSNDTGGIEIMIKYLYLIDLSNYIYSTIHLIINYRHQWDYDSPMLIVHHLAAIILFILSHSIRMYRMGVAIIYLLEISEVFYFLRCTIKIQLSIIQRWKNLIRFIGFSSMLIIWIYNRLYRYPLIILASAVDFGYHRLILIDTIAIYVFVYYILLLIQLFNIYWSIILIKLIIHIFRNGLDQLEDVREIRCQK